METLDGGARVYDKVLDYLVDYVGEMASPGIPRFDSCTRQWHVPIFCRTEKGILPVGEIVADEEANFISIPTLEQMLEILEGQLERLPFLVFGTRKELEEKGVEIVAL